MVHESIIGSRFTGSIVGTTTVAGRAAILPTIEGRAWITGLASEMLDPTDPYLCAGRHVGRQRHDGAVTKLWAEIIAFGDKANAERQFAKDRSTRIALIQASALKACNRPRKRAVRGAIEQPTFGSQGL